VDRHGFSDQSRKKGPKRRFRMSDRVFRVPLFIFAALVLSLVGVSFLSRASAQESTPTPGVLGTPEAVEECDTTDPGSTPEGAASIYSIVSDDSEARYRAQEELAGRGAQEAVGATNAFVGQIAFDDSGAPMACSRFDVDLRTLTSDESRRDNFLYANTLETQTYPLATFILTSVEGWDDAIADGEETDVRLIGNLTVHGETKLVAWDAKVKMDGDTLSGSASTTFNMADFNITEPIVGQVLSIDDTIKLEVDIAAEKA
jgi:polyisoprenoid-binding protein YceI